jgi:hypothetical protein
MSKYIVKTMYLEKPNNLEWREYLLKEAYVNHLYILLFFPPHRIFSHYLCINSYTTCPL